MEDLKRNFVLLSEVAKEKKYAQEYLGLLARRGDLGSIRIGKRWYTTREWFEKFLRDSKEKKEEVRVAETKIEQAHEVIVKREIFGKKAEEKKLETRKIHPIPQESLRCGVSVPLKIRKELPPVIDPVRNKSCDSLQLVRSRNNLRDNISCPAKISNGVDLRKKALVQVKRNVKSEETAIRRGFSNSSPNFLPEPGGRSPFLPKLAFGFSVVLVLILLFQAGIVYKEDWRKYLGFEMGTVAGVSNEKNTKVAVVTSSAIEYFGEQLEKIRENFSISRVLVRAAMERDKKVE